MAISFSVLMLVAVLTLALFLGPMNFFFWRIQREDRTPLWLAAWLAACALFVLCRLLQYASLSEPMYIVIPRILLTAGYSLAWFGYELGNTFIGYRPPRWERALFIFLVTIPIMLLWTSNLILTDKIVIRTIMFGGKFHGVMTEFLYLPASLMIQVLGAVVPIRLIRASDSHKRENLLLAMGYLFIIFFSLSDYISISLNLAWIRLSDFSYLPMPIFFSYIQVQRFGRLYREMNVMVHERTAELSQANETLRAEIIERKQAENERKKLITELEVRNAESETLREGIALVVGTHDLTEIVARILDQIRLVVPFDSASVWKVEGNVQQIIGGQGLPPELSFPDEGVIINENNSALPLLEGRHTYMLYDDVQLEFAGFREPPHNYIHTWLGVPLKVREKIIGLIALDGRNKNQFNEHHAELAVTFANQVAIALENARLFGDLQSELSERKKLIEELETKNAELERFIYTVSHDLKSPLVTMKGFLGYLEQDLITGNAERLRSDTQRIARAVDKMGQLLNDVLELSRIGRFVNPPQIVLFEDLAREAIGLMEDRIQERGVTVILKPDLPAVYGDKPRLIEVLQNLLDNAVKYMGNQPEPRIEIGYCGEEDGKPLFYVKDNGVGIAREYRERIFGLFNKLDARTEGTGIGLALVKRIIEFHDGRIWVESELGLGSTFLFTLPPFGAAKPDSVI